MPQLQEAISWDGHALSRSPSRENRRDVFLAITNSASTDEGGFFGLTDLLTKRERAATLTKLLATRAHTCPIPVTMDSRRLDALEQDPDHGWGPSSQLMQVRTCQDDSLAPLKVPQGTLKCLTKAQVMVDQGLLEATGEAL